RASHRCLEKTGMLRREVPGQGPQCPILDRWPMARDEGLVNDHPAHFLATIHRVGFLDLGKFEHLLNDILRRGNEGWPRPPAARLFLDVVAVEGVLVAEVEPRTRDHGHGGNRACWDLERSL